MDRGTSPAASSQYRLDYEQQHRERRLLVEAVSFERTGLTQRRWNNIQRVLVFMLNCDRGDGMVPYIRTVAVACSMSNRTVDRAIADAKSLGILHAERRRNKSGRASNSWTIDYETLATLGDRPNGVNQRQDGVDRRHVGVNQRQNGVNSYKELTLTHPSVRTSTTTTTALPHARPCTATPECSEKSEEEIFLERVVAECRMKIPNLPDRLRAALRDALAAGVSREQLWARCRWWHDHVRDWRPEHRPGAMHDGLAKATPDMQPHEGWPYRTGQR